MVFYAIRGGLRVTWVCYSEILVGFFDSLIRILIGELSFFFFDPTLRNPSLLLPLLLCSSAVITFAVRYLRWRARVWIAVCSMMKILRNTWEPLEICMNLLSFWFCVMNSEAELKLSVKFVLNWLWFWVRVPWMFLKLFVNLWFWSVTEMREKDETVCDLARDEWIWSDLYSGGLL